MSAPMVVQAEVKLEPRLGDDLINAQELLAFEPFRVLKKQYSVGKLPGSVVLRKYRAGETIFLQGDGGGSAYYVPTADDLRQLAAIQTGETPVEEQRPSGETQAILTAFLLSAESLARPRGWLDRWINRPRVRPPGRTATIPHDGPTELEGQTREASLCAGDLFGEMSCISLIPRSATVVANVDCQVLEFTRSTFDMLHSDESHQKRIDQIYRQRTLETHLRQLELFQGLSAAQLDILKTSATLEIVKAGNILCEEGVPWSDTRPLDVFLIRNGVVQVVMNAPLSLKEHDVVEWASLCRQIVQSQPDPAAPTKPAAAPAAGAGSKPSPLEQMRAKPEAKPMPAAGVTADVPAAAKPSPLELMRAKKAAAQTGAEGASAAATPAAAEPAKKPSALDMVRMKQAAAQAGREAIASSASAKQERTLLQSLPPTVAGPPAFLIKSWLSDQVLQSVQGLADGTLAPEHRQEATTLVLDALNALAQTKAFLSHKRIVAEIFSRPELQRKTAAFPDGVKGLEKKWSEWELRTAGRAVLGAIFPDGIRPVAVSGPPRTLAYLSRGDCIGEMALVTKSPRNATCIAYNHPSSEVARDFGDVELARIPGSAFLKLLSESPELKARVEAIARERAAKNQTADISGAESDLIASPEFQQLGLFQGQRLLVIDLDKCTRCGDCVDACINTHDDGNTRLYLDGPRFDRFLVPSACRNCLNPVCMLGCPVGSIGRGDNGQIEIYDWCIGCQRCADQCPYDSIQMHDLGIIPEDSPAWRYALREALPDDWQRKATGKSWSTGVSAFDWTGDFLRAWHHRLKSASADNPLRIAFQHTFSVANSRHTKKYRLAIKAPDDRSAAKVLAVWLNGREVAWSGRSVDLDVQQFHSHRNLLAIEIALPSAPEYGKAFFSARLDSVSETGLPTLQVLGPEADAEIKLTTHRAVVCDLCSHLPGKAPACVTSCPHDAAIRINPMLGFPF
jgi:Fe-S-cluster-containing hydrogenase component 2/CRP-like cAMP-binding protein